ncbi:FAD-dependent monooxygenase [Microlunatus ginsengisoli]|uniref:FAD-dependent monooxygenase n=1 Tax=Microlunatus ginsengisoli TaxID=363863 RepID=A0ABP6ZG10_9ACTN
MVQRALISGAGVAGIVAGWWLTRYGWECTLVERFPAIRTGGQNIDLRGAARDVLRRMHLDEEVGARGTGEVGTRFVDEDDRSVGEFVAGMSDSDGATAEREILRGQLVGLLYERTRDAVDYPFGTWIERLDGPAPGRGRSDGRLPVELSSGQHEDVDVVIIAEGIGSNTREQLGEAAFGPVRRRELGVSIAYFSIDRPDTDDDWWRWYNAAGGRAATLRPDNVGRQRATLSMRTAPVARDPRVIECFADRFRDAGWETPRLVDGLLRSDDVYVDDVAQIMAPRWSAGRAVLVGDAAYCPSPVSGMGASLAVVGAYVLAGELATRPDVGQALDSYEQVMRPYVDKAQQLPPGAPGIMHPRSTLGVSALRTAFRLAASGPLRRFEQTLFRPPADRIELPTYRR